MGTEQEVAALKARVAGFEEQEKRRAIADAVGAEIGKYELTSPSAAEQLRQLILPGIGTIRTNEGRDMLFGPGYQPLETHVAEVLQKPAYAHFLKQKATAAPPTQAVAPGHAATAPPNGRPVLLPDGRPGAAFSAIQGQPGENFGMAIARQKQADQQAEATLDPRMNPAMPMALGRRGVLPK